MERRFVNYNFTRDELRMMRDFMRDYDYVYGYGNDTVVQLANTELFRKLTHLFDNRAKAVMGIYNETTDYLKK